MVKCHNPVVVTARTFQLWYRLPSYLHVVLDKTRKNSSNLNSWDVKSAKVTKYVGSLWKFQGSFGLIEQSLLQSLLLFVKPSYPQVFCTVLWHVFNFIIKHTHHSNRLSLQVRNNGYTQSHKLSRYACVFTCRKIWIKWTIQETAQRPIQTVQSMKWVSD